MCPFGRAMSATDYHFMRLPERIQPANRGATTVDEFYPTRLMDELVADPAVKLLDLFSPPERRRLPETTGRALVDLSDAAGDGWPW